VDWPTAQRFGFSFDLHSEGFQGGFPFPGIIQHPANKLWCQGADAVLKDPILQILNANFFFTQLLLVRKGFGFF